MCIYIYIYIYNAHTIVYKCVSKALQPPRDREAPGAVRLRRGKMIYLLLISLPVN